MGSLFWRRLHCLTMRLHDFLFTDHSHQSRNNNQTTSPAFSVLAQLVDSWWRGKIPSSPSAHLISIGRRPVTWPLGTAFALQLRPPYDISTVSWRPFGPCLTLSPLWVRNSFFFLSEKTCSSSAPLGDRSHRHSHKSNRWTGVHSQSLTRRSPWYRELLFKRLLSYSIYLQMEFSVFFVLVLAISSAVAGSWLVRYSNYRVN